MEFKCRRQRSLEPKWGNIKVGVTKFCGSRYSIIVLNGSGTKKKGGVMRKALTCTCKRLEKPLLKNNFGCSSKHNLGLVVF